MKVSTSAKKMPKTFFLLSKNSLHFSIDELSREEDVLEWLIENKSTGDDEDVIEEVTAKTLGTLINNIDNLVVVFCE
jgi:chorismate mutase